MKKDDCRLCSMGVMSKDLKSELALGKTTVKDIAKRYNVDEEELKTHIAEHHEVKTLSTIRSNTNNFEEFYMRSLQLMMGLERWVGRVIRDDEEINDFTIRQLTTLTKEYKGCIELCLKMEQYRDASGYGTDLKWKTRYEQLIDQIYKYGCQSCKEMIAEAIDE
jgi:energy-converting hydrogenase A subunit M